MNPRVLTLLKNPEFIQREDLEILNSSIREFPYIQSIRVLQLMGIHQFNPELYQQELSKTAAYTTDKKILYHLINKKTIEEVQNSHFSPEIPEPHSKIELSQVDDEVLPIEFTPPKPVEIDGVINRILFEGEEDFWEMDHQTIDLESTIESGTLVTNKKPSEEVKPSGEPEKNRISEAEDVETFSTETVIPEEEIAEKETVLKDQEQNSFQEIPETITDEKLESSAEKIFEEVPEAESFSTKTIVQEEAIIEAEKVVEDPSKLSFHASQDFLPDVKINPATSSKEINEAPKKPSNKHEDEMQRLIAEVEEKMKLLKKDREKEPEIIQNNDINFSETQEFEPEIKTKATAIIPARELEKEELNVEKQEIKSDWKPMNFSGSTPDALLDKKIEPTKEAVAEKSSLEKEEERPTLNMSFFSSKTENIAPKKEEIIEEKIADKTPEALNPENSNFPKFLDTWQNWLKIDRKAEVPEEIIEVDKVEVKNNIIENFIQKEPRISKLKEESEFVFKEKDGNISHLMTETLANLYTSQKLYAKAIKAYEILGEKHPDKKEYFLDLIQKTKDLRKNS